MLATNDITRDTTCHTTCNTTLELARDTVRDLRNKGLNKLSFLLGGHLLNNGNLSANPNIELDLLYEQSITSFYAGEIDYGSQLSDELLLRRTSSYRDIVRKNSVFYAVPLPAKLSKLSAPDLGPIWKPLNPSIIANQDHYLVNCRYVNYVHSAGAYTSSESDGKIRTRNYLLKLNSDLELLSSQCVELDPTIPLTLRHVQGLEDCRITKQGDQIWLTTNSYDNHPLPHPQISIGRYSLSDNRTDKLIIKNLNRIPSPENRCEKNWLPFFDESTSNLRVVYGFQPTTLLDLTVPDMADGLGQVIKTQKIQQTVNLSDCRGGSGPIPYRGGYLVVIHEVVFNPGRQYLHRFLHFDSEWKIQRVSRLWYFRSVAIEYCSGSCLLLNGTGVLLTYGLNDGQAETAEITWNELETLFQPIEFQHKKADITSQIYGDIDQLLNQKLYSLADQVISFLLTYSPNLDQNELYYRRYLLLYYLGKISEGNLLAEQLRQRNPNDHIRLSVRRNLKYYVPQLPNISSQQLTFPISERDGIAKEHWYPLNPSIVTVENGYIIICRVSNYQLLPGDNRYQIHHPKENIISRTYLLKLDSQLQIATSYEVFDKSYHYRRSHIYRGAEDPRVFEFQKTLWFSASTWDTHQENCSKITLHRLDSSANQHILEIFPLEGPVPQRIEKNWIPLIDDNDCLQMIYSYHPLVVYRPDLDTGLCYLTTQKTTPLYWSDFRGSAGTVSVDNGYLLLIHEYVPSVPRNYLHRFLWLSKDWNTSRLSLPFTFLKVDVEFASGVCLSLDKQHLLITFGFRDSAAWLVKVTLESVMSQLSQPITLTDT